MSQVEEKPSRWGRTFSALRHPNFRLWFWGQMISMFGTWMQATAQGFLVYELTHSPKYLGIVAFANGAPSWFIMLYAGVIADRMSRRKLLILTQSAMMVQALMLALLTYLQIVQAWHIVLLAFGLGMATAFDAPTRLSLVSELVDRKDLTNAIALNATLFNIAAFVGPAVAGITYALWGPALCFTLNGLSFIGVIIALVRMQLKPFEGRPNRASKFADLKQGIRYAVTHPIIGSLLLLTASTTMLGLSLTTLFPDWSVSILHGDASTNGWLQSFRGLGSLLAALAIASLGQVRFKGRILSIASLALPVLLMVFSRIHNIELALPALVCIGAALILIYNLANSTIQSCVEDELRGRVMGVYSFVFFGSMPLGALLIGTMSQALGSPMAILINSCLALVFALTLWKRSPQLRHQP